MNVDLGSFADSELSSSIAHGFGTDHVWIFVNRQGWMWYIHSLLQGSTRPKWSEGWWSKWKSGGGVEHGSFTLKSRLGKYSSPLVVHCLVSEKAHQSTLCIQLQQGDTKRSLKLQLNSSIVRLETFDSI